jgi:dTDP-4-amino-4,6-dideoxygalactose transaminase
MDALGAIAREHGLKMVEDAAQAFGALWHGRHAGTLGDAAAFSFYPSKNLSAYGDAGCVVTGDAAIAEHMTMMRNHGSRQRYAHEEIGANSRLGGIQAAVLRVKLEHIEGWNQARRDRAKTYDNLFSAAGLVSSAATRGVKANSPVHLLARRAEAQHIFHQYVIRVHRRDELRSFLGHQGIATEVYYPTPLHLQPCFAYLGYLDGDFPVAEQAARETLALPMFPELTAEEQRRVVDGIADFYS